MSHEGTERNARSDALDKLKHTYAVLSSDLAAAVTLANELDNQFARRTLVRTLFAFIEGMTHQLASVAIASAPLELGIFSADELAILRDEQGHRQRFRDRIKTVLRLYARIHGATFEPEMDAGWTALCKANDLRDRLTHPKGAASLQVSKEDCRNTIAAASQWYQVTVAALLKTCEAADAHYRSQIAASE